MQELLTEMEDYAAEHKVPIINEQGRAAFIEAVQKSAPHRVLEIGTAIGYSALLLAMHGAEDVTITTMELTEERAGIARAFWAKSPYAGSISLLTGDAGELLENIACPSGGYDFVFIDAAKGQYPDYFRKVLPLLADKAVILADNVLFRGYVRGAAKAPRRYRTIVKRLREYINLVEQTPGCRTTILENGDGLAVTCFERQ